MNESQKKILYYKTKIDEALNKLVKIGKEEDLLNKRKEKLTQALEAHRQKLNLLEKENL